MFDLAPPTLTPYSDAHNRATRRAAEINNNTKTFGELLAEELDVEEPNFQALEAYRNGVISDFASRSAERMEKINRL